MASHHHAGNGHHSSAGEHLSPFQRLRALIKEDKKDLLILVLYTMLAGLLTLAVPLTAQALVNTIAAGVFMQPLVVLTTLLFVGMLFIGLLRISQFFLVEVLQQRLFARVALRLAGQVPFVQHKALMTDYPPELMNRFFDTIQAQKAMSKLLMDGPATILQILVGLILMAVYSPILLGFDLFIIFFLLFMAFVLGRNGVNTSIDESVQKYRVAGWLQELARCQVSFKVDGVPGYLFKKADEQVVDYIKARHSHFRVLFRQVAANYFFQAVASAGILGIGGWLVINRQLTLGQLVASELVVLILISATDKLVMMFQDWYDLLTSVEKIGHLTDLPMEREGGILMPRQEGGAHVICQDLYFDYSQPETKILKGLSLSLQPGEVVCLVGASGVGKSTLAEILCGLLEPKSGVVRINGFDVRALDLHSLRQVVALVGDSNEIFDGTVEENIAVGRPHVRVEDIHWALEITQLTDEIMALPNGLQTSLISAGRNLSRGQTQRLMIARAIVDRPNLLILDEAFIGIDECTKLKILDTLLDPVNPWTVIGISHDADVVIRADHIMVLADGVIAESASLNALSLQPNSRFSELFPKLVSSLGGQ
jgi:ATP-binding cassette subfamily B protein